MKGIKITVALTAVEKACLVLFLILLVAFVVQRNAQGICLLRQYRCHRAVRISEATRVFLQFSGAETELELTLARSGIFVKPVNFSELTVCQNYFHVSDEFSGFLQTFLRRNLVQTPHSTN